MAGGGLAARGRSFGRTLVLVFAATGAAAIGVAPAQEVGADAPRALAGLAPLRPDVLAKPVLELRMRGDWDRAERGLLWSYLALSAIDTYQAVRRPPGFDESNPLVTSWAGRDASAAELTLFKATTTYGIVRLADRVPAGARRKTALALLVALQLAVDVRNERITGGIVVP